MFLLEKANLFLNLWLLLVSCRGVSAMGGVCYFNVVCNFNSVGWMNSCLVCIDTERINSQNTFFRSIFCSHDIRFDFVYAGC